MGVSVVTANSNAYTDKSLSLSFGFQHRVSPCNTLTALNSLCRLGWLPAHRDPPCLCVLSAGIKDLCHNVPAMNLFLFFFFEICNIQNSSLSLAYYQINKIKLAKSKEWNMAQWQSTKFHSHQKNKNKKQKTLLEKEE